MVTWPDDIDEIIAGDLTAALAYCTPAGGAVVTAVAPLGLRDRDQGTITFTTSLGFGRKLDRIARNPRVALAYHAREHGFAGGSGFVLVQGEADPQTEPDRDLLENVIGPQAERFMGPAKRGKLFWDRWLQEYYADRVPVTVRVERILAWPDAEASGEPRAFGSPPPPDPPAPQEPPRNGAGPRLDSAKAARRIGALPNQLLAFVGADGFPEVRPIRIGAGEPGGIALQAPRPLPPGGRRAGLLAHRYNAHLIGLEARGHTGWLTVSEERERGLYAPHTGFGFRAPANKTLLLLANGLLAKRGLRKARRAAAAA
jgi:Pyridoxamine 5'-phosphate oxidase